MSVERGVRLSVTSDQTHIYNARGQPEGTGLRSPEKRAKSGIAQRGGNERSLGPVRSSKVPLRQVAEAVAQGKRASPPANLLIHIHVLEQLPALSPCAVVSRPTQVIEPKIVVTPQPAQLDASQCAGNRSEVRPSAAGFGDVGIPHFRNGRTRLQVTERSRIRLQGRQVDPRDGRILAHAGGCVVLSIGRGGSLSCWLSGGNRIVLTPCGTERTSHDRNGPDLG